MRKTLLPLLCLLVPVCVVAPQQVRGGTGAQDVLVFGAQAPSVIRLAIQSTGGGLTSLRDRYAEVLLQALDRDEDQVLSADEASKLPRTGRFSAEAEALGDQWRGLDVIAPDDRLTLEELRPWLDRLLGDELTVRLKPPRLVQSVDLQPRLDDDGDGRVSRDEISRGVETLRAFDFDDDQTFSPAELQPFPMSMLAAAMASANSPSDRRMFVVLTAAEPLEPLAQRIIDQYGALGAVLGPPWAENGEIVRAEQLVAWLQAPRPDVELQVDLRLRQLRPQPAGAAVASGRVRLLPAESSRRVSLFISGETLEFTATDNRHQAADQISLVRIGFLRQDGDKNRYLDEREFAAGFGVGGSGMGMSFADVDLDRDGNVFLNELDRTARLDAYLSQCHLELVVDVIETPLFQILDANLDRRLSLREFRSPDERIPEFDRNADGELDAGELSVLRKVRIDLSYGVPPAVRIERRDQPMSQQRMPVMQSSLAGPEWFRRMDRNQDGELTWREFLGPRSAFEQLDRDDSGWIDAPEAEMPAPASGP